jgi:hypothetical protein
VEGKSKMESNSQKPKLWNPGAAGNLSIIFSPIFGALILSKNWKELNESGKAKFAMLWAYAGIILVIVSMFMDSAISLALPYLIIWYLVECRKQVKFIKQNLNNDYDKKSWGGAILKGIGIIALIFVLLGIGSAIGGGSSSSKVPIETIEESALPIVNSMLKDAEKRLGRKVGPCLVVDVYKELGNGKYKAAATLDKGEDLELLLTRKGDNLLVEIVQ